MWQIFVLAIAIVILRAEQYCFEEHVKACTSHACQCNGSLDLRHSNDVECRDGQLRSLPALSVSLLLLLSLQLNTTALKSAQQCQL